MSELVENALEADGIIIGTDESGRFGLFAGDGLPHELIPDAPAYSIYYRTNGETYRNRQIVAGGELPEDWEENAGAGMAGCLPVILGDNDSVLVELSAASVPLRRADGAVLLLDLVACN